MGFSTILEGEKDRECWIKLERMKNINNINVALPSLSWGINKAWYLH